MKKRDAHAARRPLLLCLLAFGLVMLARGESKADTIVISLSEPGISVPLLIPEGQVITSVNYSADYTATITRPCTISDPCDSPSTIPRARVLLNGHQILNVSGFNNDISGTITEVLDPSLFVNFTSGSASLVFDTNRISLALSNGLLTVQTAPAQLPEPATLLLLGTGLSGVAAAARRFKARGK